jgi:tetratricopeptide (TPR) repeat protein
MRNFRIWNLSLGWLSFAIATIVYILTLEPTVSWWDCGEFIACSYKLQIGHPPGAPLFLMMGRVASLFASNTENVAFMVNLFSGLASSFTILFLFWSITHLAQKFAGNKESYSLSDSILILGSGLVGSLAYAFSDSAWFSAVEGEVYGTSSLFTAVVFWAILKWENVADEPHANRWLILIAYLMGLSIGVHLLNLLAIPAIVLVYYFKKYKYSLQGMLKALGLSVIILGVIMYGIINGLVKIASWFELLFVNGFGMPFNTGVLIYAILIIGLVGFGIWYTQKHGKIVLNTAILCFAVIIIGYSSYAMIVIRSHANPPMDENNPQNVFSLLSYLNREQYGDRPLIFGHNYDAEIARNSDGYAVIKEKQKVYQKDEKKGKYIVAYRKPELTYSDNAAFLPRMYSREPDHVSEYKRWGMVNENQSPGFFNNIIFFFNYQVGHMYLRYFLWNFAGKQNDEQSYGSLVNGNWISGIKFIDEFRLGDQDALPDKYKENPARNTYYFLPLILGILGLLFHISAHRKDFAIVGLLFFMTGLAIVLYLNQTPMQPRERDYAYAGSFYAFSIWIGLGVFGLFDTLKNKWKNQYTAILVVALSFIFVPGLMAAENWRDHNRSGRYTARDIARDYLDSCEKNAILFTNGDNDTFPLWYVQEVEGYRTDVRVVNLMLFNTEWHIDQMKMKAYDSDALPITFPYQKYADGTNGSVYVKTDTRKINVKTLIEGIKSEHQLFRERTIRNDLVDVLPTANLILDVDSAKLIENKTVKPQNANLIEKQVSWTLRDIPISKANLIQLDILANNNWNRPVYFVAGGNDGTLGLEDYFQMDGLAYRLVPIKTKSPDFYYELGRIDTDILYENLMKKFKWGRMNEPDVYMDYYNVRTMGVIKFRKTFVRLAEALALEGKKEKAVEVLDRCMELAPNDKLPYDHFISGITYNDRQNKAPRHYSGVIEAYYKCGDFEKANKIILEFAEILQQDLQYYQSLDERFKSRFENEAYQSQSMYNELVYLADVYRQEEVLRQIK